MPMYFVQHICWKKILTLIIISCKTPVGSWNMASIFKTFLFVTFKPFENLQISAKSKMKLLVCSSQMTPKTFEGPKLCLSPQIRILSFGRFLRLFLRWNNASKKLIFHFSYRSKGEDTLWNLSFRAFDEIHILQ